MLSETINNHIKTIDDECIIAQSDDHYRTTRLLTYLARKNHPITQFSWGKKSFLIHFVKNFLLRKQKKFKRFN